MPTLAIPPVHRLYDANGHQIEASPRLLRKLEARILGAWRFRQVVGNKPNNYWLLCGRTNGKPLLIKIRLWRHPRFKTWSLRYKIHGMPRHVSMAGYDAEVREVATFGESLIPENVLLFASEHSNLPHNERNHNAL